jgi:pimeloyl-ACP methyl ester carboxylesterase
MPEISVNATTLWYERQGSGAPLLLLPGLGLDHNYYRFAVPLLAPHFEVISVDPRGVGQSVKDDPAKVRYSPELWADDFAALIYELGLGPVNVLGSSLGGAMAMSMALRHPHAVKSLVVVGGFADMDRAMAMNFDLRKRLIAKLGMGPEVADFMGLSTMTREFMETDHGLRAMRDNQATILRHAPALYTAFLDATLGWGCQLAGQEDVPPPLVGLGAINVPSLVIAGDNDYFIPAHFSRRISDRIAGAIYREVAGGGHIPFIEKPEETARLVIDFLADPA